jgi:hypothetical protein
VEAALVALALGCFHASAITLYLSNAVIYEILCFGFYYGAFLYYLRIRQSGRPFTAEE